MIQVLRKMMDACAMQHKVIANNLANSETKGFRRQDVEFKQALAKAMESGKPGAIADVRPKIVSDMDSPMGAGANNVSTQRELGRMAENNLLYEVAARALSGKYSRLQSAIKGR